MSGPAPRPSNPPTSKPSLFAPARTGAEFPRAVPPANQAATLKAIFRPSRLLGGTLAASARGNVHIKAADFAFPTSGILPPAYAVIEFRGGARDVPAIDRKVFAQALSAIGPRENNPR
jgi:hypothetical protein